MDYRALNKTSDQYKHPIPITDELLDNFFCAGYFSNIDLKSAYHQICMKEEDIQLSIRRRTGKSSPSIQGSPAFHTTFTEGDFNNRSYISAITRHTKLRFHLQITPL